MPRRRGFGAIRELPSKRYQASYVGPDTIRHMASVTFETAEDAEAWLTDRRRGSTTFAAPERSWPPAPAPQWPN